MPFIGILSDTHGILPERWQEFFEPCSEIWHAGDAGDIKVLDQLAAFKPLKAVYGNIDNQLVRRHTPEHLFFNCGELRVLLRHIAGKPGAYYPEAKRQIAHLKPDVLVCGHSHILMIKYDEIEQLLFINPGAAGKFGFHQMITMLRVNIDGREISGMEIWEKPRSAFI